jgi:hypothetical protein
MNIFDNNDSRVFSIMTCIIVLKGENSLTKYHQGVLWGWKMLERYHIEP